MQKKEFAKQIRDIRHELDLNQIDFAHELEVKQGTISKIEAGHVLPSTRVLLALRKVFQTDLNELFDSVNDSAHSVN